MQVIKNYKQPWDVLFTLLFKSELSLLSKSYNFYRATENFALFLSIFLLKFSKVWKETLMRQMLLARDSSLLSFW